MALHSQDYSIPLKGDLFKICYGHYKGKNITKNEEKKE